MADPEEPKADEAVAVETEEERTKRLKKFVLDYCDGHIFTDRHLRNQDDLFTCFTVLGFMEKIPEGTVLVWEHIKEAGPLSINGNPCFFSAHFMKQADWDRVRPAIERELERRKGIEL